MFVYVFLGRVWFCLFSRLSPVSCRPPRLILPTSPVEQILNENVQTF